MFWVRQLINGLTQGSIYALLAIGYSLIFGKLLLVTFAFGEIVVFGVLIFVYLYTIMGFSLFVSMIIALPIAWVFGILVDKICYEKFRGKPRFLMLITTIGFGIFLQSFTQIVFGTGNHVFPTFIKGQLSIGEINVNYINIFIIAVTIVLLVVLSLFFNKTKLGMGIKAISMDQDAVMLVGVNVNKSVKFGHSLGCVIGVFAGIMLASFYNVIGAGMGPMLGLKAFTVVVFGGITSMPGAVLAAYILGILENLSVATFGSVSRDIVAFSILIIVLVLRPSGLLGEKIDLF